MIEKLASLLPRRSSDERGASAVEYGLLIAGIAAIVVLIVFTLGGTISDSFNDTCNAIQNDGEEVAAGTECE